MTPVRPIAATPNRAIGLGSGTGATPSAPLLAALSTILPVVLLSPKTSTRRLIGEVIVTSPRTAPGVKGPGKRMSAAACSALGNLIPFTAPFAIPLMEEGKPPAEVEKKLLDPKVTGGRPSNVKPIVPVGPSDVTLLLVADSTNRTVSAFAATGPPVKVALTPLPTVNGPSGKVEFAGGP